jgi:hypothetical protein
MSVSEAGAAVLSPDGVILMADTTFGSALAASTSDTDAWLVGLCNLARQSSRPVQHILVDEGAVLRFVAAHRPGEELVQVTVEDVRISALDAHAGRSGSRGRVRCGVR